MRIQLLVGVGGWLFTGSASGQDEPAIKDPPGVTRMQNYSPIEERNQAFTDQLFCLGKGARKVEGRMHWRHYGLKEGAVQASLLQITRNYANAVRTAGGQILLDGEPAGDCELANEGRMMTGVIKKGAAETWIGVIPRNEGYDYELLVVEVQGMEQEVTASAMLDALNRDGRVSLYINFDTGKSTILAASQKVVTQVIELMSASTALKIAIEGHTDNVGNAVANQKLSESRAQAVMAAVIGGGIDAKRMTAAGFGASKPVADNQTEDGRAKNRRVELVKQ